MSQHAWFHPAWPRQSAQPCSRSVWWLCLLQQTLLHAAVWRMRTPATVTSDHAAGGEKCQECHKQVSTGGGTEFLTLTRTRRRRGAIMLGIQNPLLSEITRRHAAEGHIPLTAGWFSLFQVTCSKMRQAR